MNFLTSHNNDSLTIYEVGNSANRITVDAASLIALQQTVTQAIMTVASRNAIEPTTAMINVNQAVARAAAKGFDVKVNTVSTAAKRGAIQDAARIDYRWQFPIWAFDAWLDAHIRRADFIVTE